MPLVSGETGRKLNNDDIQAMKDMIRGSLESHIHYLKTGYRENVAGDVSKSGDIMIAAFEEALNGLDHEVDQANGRWRNKSAEDFMEDYFSGLTGDIMDRLSEVELTQREADYALDMINDFGLQYASEATGLEMKARNTDEAYAESASSFFLPTAPMPGIEDIAPYNPNSGRVQVLYEGRSGNSGTLENTVERAQKELDSLAPDDPDREAAQKNLNAALASSTGIRAAGEMSRIYAAEFMAKPDDITFADLYKAYSGLNKAARIGEDEGGKLRAEAISAGQINGVGTFTAPKTVFKTLTTVADKMNQIKKVKDPALQKTQAVQLASFAYGMTLSEHSFGDGNGRTSRMLADTILQTFGLPPHIPQEGLKSADVSRTLGTGAFDFNKCASVMFDGIKQSDRVLAQEREKERARENAEAMRGHTVTQNKVGVNSINYSRLLQKVGNAKGIGQGAHQGNRNPNPAPMRTAANAPAQSSNQTNGLKVTSKTVTYLNIMRDQARQASSMFNNSPQYQLFQQSLAGCCEIASIIEKKQRAGDRNFDFKAANEAYEKSVETLKTAARAYKTYKMSDHTLDPAAEPGKKPLNRDDRNKLSLINNVLSGRNVHLNANAQQTAQRRANENVK